MGAYELIEDARLYKTFTPGLRPWENHTTALAGEEMHLFTMKTLLYCKKGAKSPPKTKSSNFLTISRLRSKTLWPSPAPNLTV